MRSQVMDTHPSLLSKVRHFREAYRKSRYSVLVTLKDYNTVHHSMEDIKITVSTIKGPHNESIPQTMLRDVPLQWHCGVEQKSDHAGFETT